MQINATDILCARIINELNVQPVHRVLDEKNRLGVTIDGITLRRGDYWNVIEGADDLVKSVLTRVDAVLLDENTKRINRSPPGTDVWTVR